MAHSLSLFFFVGKGVSGNKRWVMKMLTKFGKDLAFWVQTQKVLALELRELSKALLLRSLPIPPHVEGEMAPFSDWSCHQHFQGPTLETASFVFRFPKASILWPLLALSSCLCESHHSQPRVAFRRLCAFFPQRDWKSW